MPSWEIHSYIGNQVNKTIKVNKKYFMIGNYFQIKIGII